MTEKPKWKDIVSNHNLYSSASRDVKNFAGITLGYVTPVRAYVCVRACLCVIVA